MEKCPCSSAKPFDSCCGPILEDVTQAKTAESLMRARYTAYTKGDIGFIKKTTHRSALSDFDEASARRWSKSSVWKGLEILDVQNGQEADREGEVEFVAFYTQNGKDERHHEKATFRKEGEGWLFVDGKLVSVKPFVRDNPKVGRNDLCPCSSGKKYKKCCGQAG